MKKFTVFTIGIACFTMLASAHNASAADLKWSCTASRPSLETILDRICGERPEFPIFPEKPEGDTSCTPEVEIPNEPEIEVPDEPEIPEVETPDAEAPIVPDVPEVESPEVETPEVDSNQSYEKQVLDLVNAERAKQGLAALEWSDELASVARAHSADMAERNFFSHTNPDGESPFDRIRAAGISYRTAGENIAAGQRTPQEVVNAWMNSEGHRANILNASYTKLGVGYVSGSGSYGTYWTQCFAG